MVHVLLGLMHADISTQHENTLFLMASDPEDGGNISSKRLVPVYQTTLHDQCQ